MLIVLVVEIRGRHYFVVISLAVSTTKMLHVLRQTSNELLLEFNASKSVCAVFETPPTSLPQLCLGSDLPEWSRE